MHDALCEKRLHGLRAAKLNNIETTPVGFEPTRGDPIELAGRRLNRSAKVSISPLIQKNPKITKRGALAFRVDQLVSSTSAAQTRATG